MVALYYLLIGLIVWFIILYIKYDELYRDKLLNYTAHQEVLSESIIFLIPTIAMWPVIVFVHLISGIDLLISKIPFFTFKLVKWWWKDQSSNIER